MNFIPNLPEHCNMDDRVAAQCLIQELLAAECTITINDGEEDCLEKSRDLKEILEAMSSSGEDTVIPFDKDGNGLGWFYLIYANGSEDEPMILISDLSANPFCEGIYNKVDAQLGDS
jgi:hypothetical protein|tara:strand:+ start:137 stop:487 length:351 start_codon:yes stop_codon:yes gene_type:complete